MAGNIKLNKTTEQTIGNKKYVRSTIVVNKNGTFNTGNNSGLTNPTVIVDDSSKDKIKFIDTSFIGSIAGDTNSESVVKKAYETADLDLDNHALGFTSSKVYDVIYIPNITELDDGGSYTFRIKHALAGNWVGIAGITYNQGTTTTIPVTISRVENTENSGIASYVANITASTTILNNLENLYLLLFNIGAAEEPSTSELSGLLEASYKPLTTNNDLSLLASDTKLASDDDETHYYRLPFTGANIEEVLRKAGCITVQDGKISIDSINGLNDQLTETKTSAANALENAFKASQSASAAQDAANSSANQAIKAAKSADNAKIELINSKPSIINGKWFIGNKPTDVDATGPAGKNGDTWLPSIDKNRGTISWISSDGSKEPEQNVSIKGPAGENSYFHVKYAPVINPTAEQMSDEPNVYIGTRSNNSPTAPTDPNEYTWARLEGKQGPKGDQGIPGDKGEDGKTSYLHIAYANSEDGKTDFSVKDSKDKSYIGQYTDTEEKDSTDYTKYSWTRIKGADGQPGSTGRGITQEIIKYAVSATTEEPPASSFSQEKVQPDQNNRYLWQMTVTTYTDGSTVTTSYPHIIGMIGKDGKDGTDAEVGFANVCAALGITKDITGKGLYMSKDDNGNDIVAINASTIFADDAFANRLKAIDVEADNLKVNAANIKDLTADKIVLGKNADGTSNNIELTSDGRIKAKNIEAEAITVGSTQIKDGAITTNKIAAGAVTADTIAAGAVTADTIAAGSIDASKIKANSITADKIDADALVAKKVKATEGSIAGFTISDNSLSTNGIANISDDTHDSGVYIGTDGIRLGKTFTVSKEGTVTASGFKIALTDEQKKELAGTGIVTSVARNTLTESEWNICGETGYHETWDDTATTRRGCRVNDLFTVVGTATDTRSAHVLTYKSTTASGNLEGDCISHQITERGEQGISSYTHFAYADSADGSKGFTFNSANKAYIGQCVTSSSTAPGASEYAKYQWTKIKGEQGEKGDSVPYLTVTATELDQSGAAGTFCLNGTQFATTNYNRGHTIITFDPKTQKVSDPVSYDTYGNGLSDFKKALTAISEGVIVLISSSDATSLDEESRKILKEDFGSTLTSTWTSARISHAFIGMKNHGEAFEATGSGSDGAVSISAYFTSGGLVTTGIEGKQGISVVEVKEFYALSANTAKPADSEFDNVPKTPTIDLPYVWKVTKTTYTNGNTTSTEPQIIGYKGKDGSDAEVKFSNVCNALGITMDGSDGTYWSKDTVNGKDKLVIKSSAFFADEAFTNNLTANRIILDSSSGKKIELKDGKITADCVQANEVVAQGISAATINANQITGGKITANQIDVTSLTSAEAFINSLHVKTANIDDLDVYKINADNITTGTLSADRLNIGAIAANSAIINQIQSTSISADKISGGTIDASKITVKNINANNITAGNLSADQIQFSKSGLNTAFLSDKIIFPYKVLSHDQSTAHSITCWEQGPLLIGPDVILGNIIYSTRDQDYKESEYTSNAIIYTKKRWHKQVNSSTTTTGPFTLSFPEKSGTLALKDEVPELVDSLPDSGYDRTGDYDKKALSAAAGLDLRDAINTKQDKLSSSKGAIMQWLSFNRGSSRAIYGIYCKRVTVSVGGSVGEQGSCNFSINANYESSSNRGTWYWTCCPVDGGNTLTYGIAIDSNSKGGMLWAKRALPGATATLSFDIIGIKLS